MMHRRTHLLILMSTFFITISLAFPVDLSAQWGRIIIGRRGPKAEEEARKAEEQRQAEIEQREDIARKRESQLTKASAVLKLYKRGAPAKFNFAGYEQQEALQNIYTGNFEQFTGGRGSEFLDNADAKNAVLMIRSMAGDRTAMAEQAEMMAVARRRLLIRLAYLAYHWEYAEQCGSNMEIRWEDPVPQRRSVTLPVREPFSNAYLSIFQAMGRGEEVTLGGMTPDTKESFRRDFQKLLKTQGCTSPMVRQFEINLHLATEWLFPLQELQPSLAAGMGTAQPGSSTLKSPNAKTRTGRASRRSAAAQQNSNTPVRTVPRNASSEKQSIKTQPSSQQFQISNSLLTDLQVRRGDKVTITASGRITLGVFAGSATPNGIGGFQDFSIVSQFPHGGLLVRVRQYQGDEWRFCGSSCTFTAERDGYIEFVVNDRDFANNDGSFQIQVQAGKPISK